MDDFTTNILLGSILGTLIIIFTVKALITHHNIPYFIFSFVFMASGAGFFIFLRIFFPEISDSILVPIELMFFGFSQLFMYLFLESLRTFTRLTVPFMFIFVCLIIQQFSLILVMILPPSTPVLTFIWFVADISYNLLGLITNFIIGTPIYIRNYRRSRKISAFILAIAFGIASLGFGFLFLADAFWYFSIFPVFQNIVFTIGKLLPVIGFITIIIVYIFDIHHFYQIPSNLFLLMITDTHNRIIFQSKYETSAEIQAKMDIALPNLLDSINRVFQDTYLAKTSVKIFMNKEVSMIREVRDKYSAVIVSTSESRIMISALRRFLKEFEAHFKIQPPPTPTPTTTNLEPKSPSTPDSDSKTYNSAQDNIEFYHSTAFLDSAVAIVIANFPFLMNEKQ